MSKLHTLAFLTLTVGLASCAASLPFEKNIRSPKGQAVEEVIDLSAVTMHDLDDGSEMTVGAYMDQKRLDFLLLFFGSKGCGVCTEKSVELRDRFFAEHALWHAGDTGSVELIGVSTDALASRGLVQRFALQNQFNHYRWIDPLGAAMLRWFMPPGQSISVPFTVMLSREGILWRVTANDQAQSDMAVILDRAYASVRQMGGVTEQEGRQQPGNGRPTVGQRPSDERSDDDPGAADGLLTKATTNRLRGMEIVACGSENVADLHAVLGEVDYRFVHVEPKSCDAVCRGVSSRLQAVVANCSSTRSCAGVSLLADSPESCPSGMFRGGQPFVDTFGAAFDWRHEVSMDSDWNLSLAPFDEPLLFVFDKEGNLVHTDEGDLSSEDLLSILTSERLPELARSMDLQVFVDGQSEGFAERRRQSDYTVVFGFERFCESCQHEMAAFNQPNQLFEYCAARPDVCQLFAMENTDREDYSGWEQEVNATLVQSSAFANAGLSENRIPLLFDVGSGDDPATAFLERFYTGYLAAKFPAFDRGWGGIVVYNREGRLVGKIDPADIFAGEQADPVAAFATIRGWIEEKR